VVARSLEGRVTFLIAVNTVLLFFSALLSFLTYRLCEVLEKLNAASRRESDDLQRTWTKIIRDLDDRIDIAVAMKGPSQNPPRT
jgi:hypothetical protein